MGDQQYVLRWNKHYENLSNGVIKYFKRELMCDVTISAPPGLKLKAHQAILSACSPYFESIFTENTHQNVTVMILNVEHEILTAIIEYMYKGEVNIAQKLLPEFLKTAAHLQVKGLVDSEKIGQNSDFDQHLKSASPSSENNIKYLLDPKYHNKQFTTGCDENESDSYNKDNDPVYDIEDRAEMSPNFDHGMRKRRKDSSCDNSLLPSKRYQRTPSESQASPQSSYKISPLPKSNSNDIDTSEGKRKSPNDNAHILPHQPSIKQEDRESDVSGSPQVHLPSNHLSLNSMYTISRVAVSSDKDNAPKVPQSTNLYDQIEMTPMMSLSDETEKNFSKFFHQTTKLFYSNNKANPQQKPSTSSSCVVTHNSSPSNASTSRKTGRFRPNWLEQFKWLKYDEINKTMYCIYCRKWCSDIPDIRTSFVEGNSNFRLEIVNHHDKCKAHKMCHERELKSLQQQM